MCCYTHAPSWFLALVRRTYGMASHPLQRCCDSAYLYAHSTYLH